MAVMVEEIHEVDDIFKEMLNEARVNRRAITDDDIKAKAKTILEQVKAKVAAGDYPSGTSKGSYVVILMDVPLDLETSLALSYLAGRASLANQAVTYKRSEDGTTATVQFSSQG